MYQVYLIFVFQFNSSSLFQLNKAADFSDLVSCCNLFLYNNVTEVILIVWFHKFYETKVRLQFIADMTLIFVL